MNKPKKRSFARQCLAWILCTAFIIHIIFADRIPVWAEAGQAEVEDTTDGTETDSATGSYITEDYRIDFRVDNRWDSGYQAGITITNTGTQKIENWHLALSSELSIVDIWNAEPSSKSFGYSIFKNQGWNQDINIGASVSFGFTTDQPFQNYPKQVFLFGELSNVSTSDYSISYSVDPVWDSGYKALITITNQGTDTIEDWNLTFTLEQSIRELWDGVILEQEEYKYHIGNAGYNQNIPVGESVSFGFIIDSEHYETVPREYQLTSVKAPVDRGQDSDGDGLPDYLETEIGTNPYAADSDGDGIEDAYEYLILLTDPMRTDTDGNGVWDGEEDFDEDGLNNKAEFQHGTDPFSKATDGDGLSDYNEIFMYHTNPIQKDSDADGLDDDDEFMLGFDPCNPDTDGNTILDGDEAVEQQKSIAIAESELPIVTGVTVDMNISGNIEKVLDIENTYKQDLLSSDVVGLAGVPVDIHTDRSFQEAVITFHYDDTKLGEIPEKNLAVLWYDEANHWYEILDQDSVVNTELNTVSYKTTHFSTYMLVDKEEWYQAWKKDMNYRINQDGTTPNYDIAFVIDSSGSMRGTRIENAVTALKQFLHTLSGDDKRCLITFNNTADVLASFSDNPLTLLIGLDNIYASGGTNVDSGLQSAIQQFNTLDSENEKIIILLCDGEFRYNEITVSAIAGMGIKIYAVNVGSTSADIHLKRMAQATGGEYYYCRSSEEIETMFGEIQGETIGSIDTADTDGDGLFDVYETVGFRLVNGRIITSDPNQKDTDGDGLTDYEETGIVYNMNYPDELSALRYIGNGESIRAPYIMAYSDPKKKDTDGDGLNDNVDPYPWSLPCEKGDGVNAHKHLTLGEDGYYTCRDCGTRIQSPALQDAEVLSEKDLASVMACNVMFTYYMELVYELYGTVEYVSLNQMLLVNQIAKIRQKYVYNGCYEYSDENGTCICETYCVDSGAICTIDVKNMTEFDRNMYNGLIPNTASLATGLINPAAGLLVTVIGTEAMRDANQELTPMEFATYVFSALATIKGTDTYNAVIQDIGMAISFKSINDSINNKNITMDDYQITIYLHRGGTGRSVKQSHGLFVVSGEGVVKWHQYAEYGYEQWEDRLKGYYEGLTK